jgi:hypothetical protein
MFSFRLIIPPAVVLVVVRFLVFLGFFSGDDKLMQLIIVIEAASPSAQMVIVSLSALGFQQLASQIAYMYVFQYAACIFSITIVATIALSLIYPLAS